MAAKKYSHIPWSPRSHRRLPDFVESIPDGTPLVVAAAKWILPSEVAAGRFAPLKIQVEGESLAFPDGLVVPPADWGPHANANVNGKTIVRRDQPKEERTIEWEGWAFGEHWTTFHRTDQFYERERRHGAKLGIELRLLDSDQIETDTVHVVAAKLHGNVTKGQPGWREELLFRYSLLQEVFGASTIFLDPIADDDLFSMVFVGWKLLPPGLRTASIARLMTATVGALGQQKLLERLEYLRTLAPGVQILVAEGGFEGYFLAKVRDDLVIAEHLTPGNAIYVFGADWYSLSKKSRTELIDSRIYEFKRIKHDHEGSWKETIAKIIEGH